ncbi:MAG: hypothetical protein V8R81_01910 [Clostridia bacterium]
MKVVSVWLEQEELYDSIRTAEFLRKIGENKKYESGLRRGEQKGKKLEKVELAKKMLQRKIDLKEVMEITGLKENELKAMVV